MSIRNSVQLSSDVQLSKFATDCFWTSSSWRAFASSSAADGATPMPFFVIQMLYLIHSCFLRCFCLCDD